MNIKVQSAAPVLESPQGESPQEIAKAIGRWRFADSALSLRGKYIETGVDRWQFVCLSNSAIGKHPTSPPEEHPELRHFRPMLFSGNVRAISADRTGG
ncbi:hypothetical protein [Halodurantibacterium flavum]|uniref:Uncharacterized protein n=1 Tax=Halodurantibacterium flavum TaxID=1382802 RepID=A0ABW4S8P5_9RHOB